MRCIPELFLILVTGLLSRACFPINQNDQHANSIWIGGLALSRGLSLTSTKRLAADFE